MDIIELLETNKDKIRKVINNKLTYDKWKIDRISPVWAYSIIPDQIIELNDQEHIKSMLLWNFPHMYYSLDKEDVETYKLLHGIIEKAVDEAIRKGFN